MPEYNPDAIQRAAVNVVQMPYPTLDRARQYVIGPCVLEPSAFGIIASAWVVGPYEKSRSAMVDNLKVGLDKLEDMARGLDQTAVDAVGVDVASRIDIDRVESSGDSSEGQGRWLGRTGAVAGTVLAAKAVGATAVGTAPAGAILASSGTGIMSSALGTSMLANALRPVHTSILGILRTSGSMAFTAAAAAAVWMLCNPNDEAVATTIGGWEGVSSEIGRAEGELDTAVAPLQQNWNAEDYEVFIGWVNKYKDGLTAAADFSDANKANLEAILTELHQLQRACFIIAMANLLLIIALTILEKVPYIGPAITAKKYALGISVVVQTIAGATSWAAIVNKAMGSLDSVHSAATGDWSELQVLNVEGAGEDPGFEGLPETDWESPANR